MLSPVTRFITAAFLPTSLRGLADPPLSFLSLLYLLGGQKAEGCEPYPNLPFTSLFTLPAMPNLSVHKFFYYPFPPAHPLCRVALSFKSCCLSSNKARATEPLPIGCFQGWKQDLTHLG